MTDEEMDHWNDVHHEMKDTEEDRDDDGPFPHDTWAEARGEK